MKSLREKRIKKIRKKIFGTADRPRLSVFRSNRYIYAQIINDQIGQTLLSASEKELKNGKGAKIDRAKKVGELIAKKILTKKIKTVVFDRGGYRYHGRVKALADAAREGGLIF